MSSAGYHKEAISFLRNETVIRWKADITAQNFFKIAAAFARQQRSGVNL